MTQLAPPRLVRLAARLDTAARSPATRGHVTTALRTAMASVLVWAAVNGPLHALGAPLIDGWAALGLVFVPRVWRLLWESSK